ncbi:MAG: hypothetical protein ABI782_12145 [Anaerolineaceae bacterium]
MQIDVIEFELACSAHGIHKVLVPVEFPRPRNCAHCFLPAVARREIRRFSLSQPLPSLVGSEAFIG